MGSFFYVANLIFTFTLAHCKKQQKEFNVCRQNVTLLSGSFL